MPDRISISFKLQWTEKWIWRSIHSSVRFSIRIVLKTWKKERKKHSIEVGQTIMQLLFICCRSPSFHSISSFFFSYAVLLIYLSMNFISHWIPYKYIHTYTQFIIVLQPDITIIRLYNISLQLCQMGNHNDFCCCCCCYIQLCVNHSVFFLLFFLNHPLSPLFRSF